MHENNKITPVGVTDWRNEQHPFGIFDSDRLGHLYCIGKTGVGKSTLLETMAISDITKGKGLAVLDPHGDVVEHLLQYIPEDRIHEVIYFNPTDTDYIVGFNPLKGVHPQYRHLVASGLVSTFKKIWNESWGPRMEHILKFSILTLLEYPDATLLDISSLLTDYSFRERVIHYVTTPDILAFWKNEFNTLSPKFRAEVISPILNKVGVFVASESLRLILGQKTRSFKMQEVIDSGKILLVNLSKGQIGEDASTILGGILLNAIQLAALYRAKQPKELRKPFYVYVDEAQSFVTLAFADMLSESRKYGVSLFLSHQYIEQLHEKIRSAIFGNVGTIISFRIGPDDALHLAKEFQPVFSESDLIHLPKFSMYLKMMINGATSKPFSAITVPVAPTERSFVPAVIEQSRKQYAKPKGQVLDELALRHTAVAEKSTLFDQINPSSANE